MLIFFNFMLSMLKKSINKIIFRNRYIKIKIKGSSMAPKFVENQTYIVDKNFRVSKLNRYQPIVFFCDIHNLYHLKRLVAFPGERVQIINRNIYVDNKKISDDIYNFSLNNLVSKNSFFCISDNSYYVGLNCDSLNNGNISNDKIIGIIVT